MAKRNDRLVIDTNIWISFLLTKDFKGLEHKIRNREVKILFSQESIEEFLSVSNRPKLKKYYDRSDLEQLMDLFDTYGEIVDVKSNVELCRDSKDDFLLSLSKDAKANYLITGDKDLLELKKFGRTRIIKIADYLE